MDDAAGGSAAGADAWRALRTAMARYDEAGPSADAANDLGLALLAVDLVEQAIVAFESALAIDPAKAEARNNIGIALRSLGRIDEAAAAFESALVLAPDRARIHLNLAYTRRFAAGDARLAALEHLATGITALAEDDRIALHFALGKAYADLDEPQRSFRHLREGNALKRRQIVYDEPAMLDVFARVRRVFSSELMRAKAGCGDGSRAPVFVVGMPRSGSTLVEQILASHSQVFGAGELDDLNQAGLSLIGLNGGSLAFPEVVATMTAEQLRAFGARVRAGLAARAPRAARVVDKSPLNMFYVGLIHLALPNARIIHTRRDPLDTCLSCFSTLFTAQPHTFDIGELGRYYRAYAELMAHWRRVLPAGVMIEIDYEDVVADLPGQARRIVAHCGLDWEDACLAFHRTRRLVKTASAAQVRRPIYRDSVGRAAAYLEELQPLLRALHG